MRISIVLNDGRSAELRAPAPGSAAIAVPGERCPACGAELFAYGVRTAIVSHDTRAGVACCESCDATVGQLRVQQETIFGLEEDDAVLVHGRARVYDGSTDGDRRLNKVSEELRSASTPVREEEDTP